MKGISMSRKEPDDSRIVSVRLPDDLIQRLDRSLDWRATHQRLPSSRYASCCGGLGSGSMPSWRPFELIIKLISRPSRSMPSTPQLPKTATMSMVNAMSGSDGAIERGGPVPHGHPPRTDPQPSPPPSPLATISPLPTPQS